MRYLLGFMGAPWRIGTERVDRAPTEGSWGWVRIRDLVSTKYRQPGGTLRLLPVPVDDLLVLVDDLPALGCPSPHDEPMTVRT